MCFTGAVGSSLIVLFTKEYLPMCSLFPGLNFTPGPDDDDDVDDDDVVRTVQRHGTFIHIMYVITF